MSAYVYILTNKNKTTLYVGVTSNLELRVQQHKQGTCDGFTKRYNVHHLVYMEEGHSIEMAIEREKQIKSWSRKRKNTLIESLNPDWSFLA
jgi:putative endonuclease